MEVSLNMRCTICSKPLNECQCSDRAAEMRKIAYTPDSHVAFKWCRKCDNHYGFCKCEQPDFYVILGGKEIKDPVFTNALGQRIEPDLTKR